MLHFSRGKHSGRTLLVINCSPCFNALHCKKGRDWVRQRSRKNSLREFNTEVPMKVVDFLIYLSLKMFSLNWGLLPTNYFSRLALTVSLLSRVKGGTHQICLREIIARSDCGSQNSSSGVVSMISRPRHKQAAAALNFPNVVVCSQFVNGTLAGNNHRSEPLFIQNITT